MISNCGHDENGRYTGGKPGDQTGGEWAVIPWYSRPWKVVLRYPDIKVGEEIAKLSRAAAENDRIGYCQAHRTNYWTALKAAGYDPSKITKAVEADCSAGVAANVKAVGYRLGKLALRAVPATAYTGNLRAALLKAGFKALTTHAVLSSDDYLKPGDVLLYDGHHTAVNLDYGKEVKPVKAFDYVNLGWNHDSFGWWYATGHYKGEYVRNTAKEIDGHVYFFDGLGYCVKNPTVKTDRKGALISITGDRV